MADLVIRALLFGVCIRVPDFWKLQCVVLNFDSVNLPASNLPYPTQPESPYQHRPENENRNAALPPLVKHVVPEELAACFSCDVSFKKVLAASVIAE